MKIRGQGKLQEAGKKLTQSKIVFYLALRPLTYQELWRETRIHRSILRNRLDDLKEKGIIIQHTYAIPDQVEFYGRVFNGSLFKPCFGNKYYLLNCSSPEWTQLYEYYLENNNRSKNKMTDIHISNIYQKVDIQEEKFNLAKIRALSEEIDEYRVSTFEAKNKELKFFVRKQILSNSIRSAVELLAIGQGILNLIPMTKEDIVHIRAITDFFISEYFSVYDSLIRLSITPVHNLGPVTSKGYCFHNYHLSTVPYIELWDMMHKLGYLINPYCYVNRHKQMKENKLNVFTGNPIDMMLVQIFSAERCTKALCDEFRFILEGYRNPRDERTLLLKLQFPSEVELNLLKRDFENLLQRIIDILFAMYDDVFRKIGNDIHGKVDKDLEKRIDSLFRIFVKTRASGIDEIVFTIKEYLGPNKSKRSLKDQLGMFSVEARSAVRGDRVKIKVLSKAIKYIDDLPVLINLSTMYKRYDARNIHKILSEAALGSDKYESGYSGTMR
jgi:DNA-binding Lrp family transcriptional regulator